MPYDIFRYMLVSLRQGVITSIPSPKHGELPLVGCPRLLVQGDSVFTQSLT
jgi:hypothetical protein